MASNQPLNVCLNKPPDPNTHFQTLLTAKSRFQNEETQELIQNSHVSGGSGSTPEVVVAVVSSLRTRFSATDVSNSSTPKVATTDVSSLRTRVSKGNHIKSDEETFSSPGALNNGDTPSKLSWADQTNNGEFIPKEVLELEAEYEGFSLMLIFYLIKIIIISKVPPMEVVHLVKVVIT
ncbi:hypothetical protein F0562_032184 [Nyssa sinensis]|uniref:Uncharacterized protein n=1 Tax=Nyssa sinensis TaxID=561372 RepID=A0A5J5AYV3_9ASTE|nr:hypothetical protein F0562_032184 [Nyssa sinensis]